MQYFLGVSSSHNLAFDVPRATAARPRRARGRRHRRFRVNRSPGARRAAIPVQFFFGASSSPPLGWSRQCPIRVGERALRIAPHGMKPCGCDGELLPGGAMVLFVLCVGFLVVFSSPVKPDLEKVTFRVGARW